ncbi:hypothetical protein [Streptomyces sp. NPDC050848]|uniref:hypothetical protein n=1 Tax=Streptomyces sp. NPDC050848 TaxID=3155791 RepID=UPI0033F957C3
MSAHEILQRMEAALAVRAEAIKPLAEIQGQRAELLRRLAALDEPYGRAYAEAEAAGWSTEELRELGAEEPKKRPKGRPRSRRQIAKTSAAASASEAPSPPVVPAQDGSGSGARVTARS